MSLLGISQDSLSIIFDLAIEVKKITSFKLYSNLDNAKKPYLPNKGIKFQLMPFSTFPEAPKKVFFGCATPQNKEAIFNFFYEEYGINKYRFESIIHTSSYIAGSCKLDSGVLIEPHTVISSQSQIGFGVFIKRGSLIGHHNTIGDFTDINPGVVISGKVNIGRGCIIGSGAVIKDNINIGDNTVIGIGSIVTKNIPANCIAYGNPCRIVKENK